MWASVITRPMVFVVLGLREIRTGGKDRWRREEARPGQLDFSSQEKAHPAREARGG